MTKKALITGITGQDGSYLAELLLAKATSFTASNGAPRLQHPAHRPHLPGPARLGGRFLLHYGDLTDATNLIRLVEEVQPTEIYNLAAQSHVHVTFESPNTRPMPTAWARCACWRPSASRHVQTRFYQASTSEMFGLVQETPQSERTPFYPRSPYGAAKAFAFWTTVNYREAYGLYACTGILFNHESPRRDERFVTRKITRAVARIRAGLEQKVYLGNLDARRDWGTPTYVRAMWQMLNREAPDDFVIATGETHSVREFAEAAFAVGVRLSWRGSGADEVGVVDAVDAERLAAALATHQRVEAASAAEQRAALEPGVAVVRVDPRYYRPTEVGTLLGDATKARERLGWSPTVGFAELVAEMVGEDLAEACRDELVLRGGFDVREHRE